MNISQIKPHRSNSSNCEEWYYWIDKTRYRYRTINSIRINKTGEIISPATWVTEYDGEMRLTESQHLSQFLPLDPNCPAKGIERFYKLLMLQ
jgi:hypothetical protein